jgi:hypothetical protein
LSRVVPLEDVPEMVREQHAFPGKYLKINAIVD